MAVQLVSKLGEWDLPDGDLILGRHSTADLCIDDVRLSRRHAEFRIAGTTVTVRDLGSINGILVNGDRIQGEARLQDGDLIVIGPIAFTIAIDEGTEAHRALSTREGNKVSSDPEFMPSTDRQVRPTVNMDPEEISALLPMGMDGKAVPRTDRRPARQPDDDTTSADRHAVTDQLEPDQSAKVATDALAPKDPAEALVMELRSIRFRRLIAGVLDPLTGLILAACIALPLSLGGLSFALQQAGARLVADRPTLGGPGDPAGVIALAGSLLRPENWEGLPTLVVHLHTDHRQQFVIFFVATTLAILAVVLTLLFYLVAATMISGGPFWHRRLDLVIREMGTGYYPIAWRSVLRWVLLPIFAPLTLLTLFAAYRGLHDTLAGCRVGRRQFIATRKHA